MLQCVSASIPVAVAGKPRWWMTVALLNSMSVRRQTLYADASADRGDSQRFRPCAGKPGGARYPAFQEPNLGSTAGAVEHR